jgi:hypothetical protein
VLFMSSTYVKRKKVQKEKEIWKTTGTLRTVPYDTGFHFYTGTGSLTGETATSLDDFERELQIVPDASVGYHLARGDFQEWIHDTLGDKELAGRIGSIETSASVERQRKEILAIVRTRINELKQELAHHLVHAHA